MKLKGTLGYYKVEESSIARGIAHFSALSLNKNVVVLINGKLTSKQYKRAKELGSIRTEKVIAAVRWLCTNNRSWEGVNYEEYVSELESHQLTVVDGATTVEDGNTNVESVESFRVYFPDGTLQTFDGGQGSVERFRETVQELKSKRMDIQVQFDLAKEAIADYKDGNFVRASLLQFPFGRGGLNERRIDGTGNQSTNIDISGYLKHMSMLSQPHFHRPLFVLILYNLHIRQRMLKMSFLRLTGKQTATNLATGLHASDVESAINAQRNGTSGGTYVANNFLSSVKAITKSVPHSNEAAKNARGTMESMQHNLGQPTFFGTVTVDDDNSFLMQVFSGMHIDDETPVDDITDEQLAARAKQRTNLRLNYPGLSALNFEILLDILFREVIGWDLVKDCPTEKEGLFGICKAVSAAIEEQGRSTLHVHFSVWVQKIQNALSRLHHENEFIRANSERILTDTIRSVATTELFPSIHNDLKQISDHGDCAVTTTRKRKLPEVVDDQKLRNLRHKHDKCTTFATCPHCTKAWTYEQLVEGLLKQKVPNFSSYPQRTIRRLEAKAVEYQKPEYEGHLDPVIINAAYNSHSSEHATSCFRSNKKLPKQTPWDDECRFKLPDVFRRHPLVRRSQADDIWTYWNGNEIIRRLHSIDPQRRAFDLFQNVSIKAVSESKMTCNSNVSVITPGPLAVYTTKYQTKGTQHDEQEYFAAVALTVQKMLICDRGDLGDRTERSEAIRVLLRASHAHNQTNVISATGASYLTRRDERFIFSHRFAFCPLRDIKALLEKEMVGAMVRFSGNFSFFENSAVNYLCRPKLLENMHVFDFYTKYDKCTVTMAERNSGMCFINTEHFDHCSYNPKTEKNDQGVRLRKKTLLLKVCQWVFPDAKVFDGDILLDTTLITHNSETYSALVLILFLPFRCKSDLQSAGSYTKKLRLCHSRILKDPEKTFLQNIQDTLSNFFHCKQLPDELQERTERFKPVQYEENMKDSNVLEQEDEVEEVQANNLRVREMLEQMEENNEQEDALDPTLFNDIGVPFRFSLKNLREKGEHSCGEKLIALVKLPETTAESGPFMRTTSAAGDTPNNSRHVEANDDTRQPRKSHSVKDVVEVIFNFRERRTSTYSHNNSSSAEDRLEDTPANGTARSIRQWGEISNLDADQQKAFEMISSSFVLTFHDEAMLTSHNEVSVSSNEGGRTRLMTTFRCETMKLKKLNRDHKQLILFLHGPGGSGKSTVIDLVLEYAKEYCGHLQHPFTSRTIVVTAMSGVAATLILGETTHSAVYMNRKIPFEVEHIEAWKDTRLLFVDEISYCKPSDLDKINSNTRILKECHNEVFGGIHLVLCGDLRQLPPIPARPLYGEYCENFHRHVNAYIELKGMHRFKDDPEWGCRLRRFRNGCPTSEDITTINNACVVKDGADNDALPLGIRYATAVNRDRDSINTATFEEHCIRLSKNGDGHNGFVEDALIVLADDLQSQTSPGKFKPLSLKARLIIWESCGEDNIKFPQNHSRRMDPALKLYRHCPLMLNENTNVQQGIANGSCVILRHVELKVGETPTVMKLASGVSVNAVMASQVLELVVEHCNTRIQPPTCSVVISKTPFRFNVKFPVPASFRTGRAKDNYEVVSMKGRQFSVLSNTATTGHKLQGATLDNLFVHDWEYQLNWPYVVLSRVRTMKGIKFRLPLSLDLSKYAMSEDLKNMLECFASTKSVQNLSDADIAYVDKEN